MSSLCGQYPLDTAEATNAILLPPTGQDKPGAEDTQQSVVTPTLKPDLKASSTSTVTFTADGDVEALVGRMSDILRVTETPEVLTIASSEWSIPKLRDFFGQDRCWAHVATSKHGVEALKACNHGGAPGHEAAGVLHSCTDQQRDHIHIHANNFRPDGYQPHKKREMR